MDQNMFMLFTCRESDQINPNSEKYYYRKALTSCGAGKKHCSFQVMNNKYNREHQPGKSYFQLQTILNLLQSYMFGFFLSWI